MMLKKVMILFVLINVQFICAMYGPMYRARVAPYTSSDRKAMQQTLYSLVDGSKLSLLASIFTFRDKEIARKLALAQARGVKVRVIMDTASDGDVIGMRNFLEEFEVPTQVYRSEDGGINHNKYVIVDGRWTWISSLNWTKTAHTKNLESAVLVYCPAIAKIFTTDFEKTCTLIEEQKKKERLKKLTLKKDLEVEREKYEAKLRAWKEGKLK